jgi:hypothetical protein
MQNIVIKNIPSQTFSTNLGGQACVISIYQKSTGLFIDVASNNVQLVSGVICRDRIKLIRYPYLKFTGDLVFVDTQGLQDPTYDGLGDRYILVYLDAAEV